MVVVQSRSKRKVSGGRYSKKLTLKRKYELGRAPSLIKLGETKVKKIRTRGANEKIRLTSVDVINVVGKDNKPKKVKVLSILESPANRHYVRRNIITKGTVIETELGKARVTNRPGQDGTLNGVLL